MITIAPALAASSPTLAAKPSTEGRTIAAVIAADEAWSAAELSGDGDYIEWLLEPEYVSIGNDGRIHAKAAIVAGARKRKSRTEEVRAADAKWQTTHPYRTSVRMFGDTAVVSFISTREGAGQPVNSSDIFVYRQHHWHAIYSQHSTAETST